MLSKLTKIALKIRITERRRTVSMMPRGKTKILRFVFAHEATICHSGQYILKRS